MTQDPIVINYAPNVVIHSENAADAAALKRRVMEILERHGRELHQVLHARWSVSSAEISKSDSERIGIGSQEPLCSHY